MASPAHPTAKIVTPFAPHQGATSAFPCAEPAAPYRSPSWGCHLSARSPRNPSSPKGLRSTAAVVGLVGFVSALVFMGFHVAPKTLSHAVPR